MFSVHLVPLINTTSNPTGSKLHTRVFSFFIYFFLSLRSIKKYTNKQIYPCGNPVPVGTDAGCYDEYEISPMWSLRSDLTDVYLQKNIKIIISHAAAQIRSVSPGRQNLYSGV